MTERKEQSSAANKFSFSKQPGSRFYSVRVMIGRRRRRFSTGETSINKAQSKAAAIMADIKSRGFDEAIKFHSKRRDELPFDPTVSEFTTLYDKVSVTLDSPPSTDSSSRYLRSLERICEGAKVTRIRALDAAAVERFKDAYIHKALGANSTRNVSAKHKMPKRQRDESSVRTTLNGILRNAASLFSKRLLTAYEIRGLKLENPFSGSQLKRVQIKAHSPFPRDLIERIWRDSVKLRDGDKTAKQPDPEANRRSPDSIDFREPHHDAFAILLLELGLGLRRNEADKAEWAWVSEAPDGRRILEVRESEGFIPKSKTSRAIPIDPAVWSALNTVKEDSKYIVPAPAKRAQSQKAKRTKKTRSAVYRCEEAHRVLVAWLRRAGVNDSKPCHALRKEFGSYVATHFSLFHAQKMLGHSSPSVTSSYYASLTDLPLLQPSQMGQHTNEHKKNHSPKQDAQKDSK